MWLVDWKVVVSADCSVVYLVDSRDVVRDVPSVVAKEVSWAGSWVVAMAEKGTKK